MGAWVKEKDDSIGKEKMFGKKVSIKGQEKQRLMGVTRWHGKWEMQEV